jgi:CheY-like chemotaxis protein
MILDDNPEIADLLATMLHSAFGKGNCQIVIGQNGHEGFSLLTQHIPDVIFTNLRMPQMDGMTFIQELRRVQEYDHVHLVMVSALATPEIVAQAQAGGVETFIRKPFTLRDIRAALNSIVNS